MFLIWATVLVNYSFAKVLSEQNELFFKQISIDKGLSQSSVFTVIQDSKGFVWLGTSDGLNRYDGYEFKIFKHEPHNRNSISSNNITCLLEDKEGNIWVGTKDGGLNLYNTHTHKFTNYLIDKENFKGLTSTYITYLFEDKSGNIWIGSIDNGIGVYDFKKKIFKSFKKKFQDKSSIGANSINCITQDKNGHIWIGTNGGGLNKFDPATETFKKTYSSNSGNDYFETDYIKCLLPLKTEEHLTLVITQFGEFYYLNDETFQSNLVFSSLSDYLKKNEATISSATFDHQNNLWLTTADQGLFVLDMNTGKFIHQQHNARRSNSLSTNFVESVFVGNNGIVFIGTDGGGLQLFNQYSINFTNYQKNPYDPNTINDNDIWSIYKKENTLLIGTSTGGLNIFNSQGQKLSVINEKSSPTNLPSNYISSITSDLNGNYWVATRDGICVLNSENDIIFTLKHDAENPNSLTSNAVYNMYQDSEGSFWIALVNKGLNVYNPQTKQFSKFKHQPNNKKSIGSNGVVCIIEDSKKNMWFGLERRGVDFYDRKRDEFIHFVHEKNNTNSLNNDDVISIFEDSYHTIWIGTSSGLNAYVPHTKKFFSIDETQGLPNGVIYSILEDHNKHLWISTNKGICQFKIPEPVYLSFRAQEALKLIQNSLRSYDENDGLCTNEFNSGVSFKDKEGNFFFGGISGLVSFHPDSIRDVTYTPPLYLSSFKVFGNEFNLDSTLESKHEIKLLYNQNYFSFDFIAPNYLNTQKIKFNYKLEGFDKDWIYIPNRRFASYTNLEPGTYTFKVKVSNNNGMWDDQYTSVRIVIKPPFWKEKWFYGASVLIAFVLIWLIIFFRERKLKRDKLVLEKQVIERTHELTEAKDFAEKSAKAKENFLSTMSHEIRTPMNAIIGMTHLLLEDKNNQEQKESLNTLKFSADNLMVLINDILDYSKIDAGKIQFEEVDFSLKELLHGIQHSLALQAKEKNLAFDFNIDDAIPEIVVGDPIRINQILTNLITNAIKFTNIGGISTRVTLVEQLANKTVLKFSVKDTGIGIRKDKQEIIFDSFEQASKDTTRKYGGTGLGLAITKRLLDLQGSKIYVESEPGVGSLFYFNYTFKVSKQSKSRKIAESALPKEESFKGLKILLVEDNAINQLIVSKFLYKWGAELNFAENGLVAVDKVRNKKFDIILMDLQMPEMDGFEAAREIRKMEDNYYKTVPILALTAAAIQEMITKASEVGINDYIAKPFNPNDLYNKIAKYCNITH